MLVVFYEIVHLKIYVEVDAGWSPWSEGCQGLKAPTRVSCGAQFC